MKTVMRFTGWALAVLIGALGWSVLARMGVPRGVLFGAVAVVIVAKQARDFWRAYNGREEHK